MLMMIYLQYLCNVVFVSTKSHKKSHFWSHLLITFVWRSLHISWIPRAVFQVPFTLRCVEVISNGDHACKLMTTIVAESKLFMYISYRIYKLLHSVCHDRWYSSKQKANANCYPCEAKMKEMCSSSGQPNEPFVF